MVKTDAVPKSVASLDVVGCMVFPPRMPELAIRYCTRMIPSCYRSRGTRSGLLTRLHNTLEGTDGPKRSFH